jgi:hypothetical protein
VFHAKKVVKYAIMNLPVKNVLRTFSLKTNYVVTVAVLDMLNLMENAKNVLFLIVMFVIQILLENAKDVLKKNSYTITNA